MAQNSGPPPIVFILLFLLMAAGGYWFFFMKQPAPQNANIPATPAVPTANAPLPAPIPGGNTGSTIATAFPPPTAVPAGTTVRLDGSTSMVTINQNLKNGFQGQFPGTNVVTSSNGSNQGIQALLAGSADIAAISRNLTPQEQGQGLVAVPIAQDAIAVVVGKNNLFNGGLSSSQVARIFQGQIADWSAVEGTAGPIRVINRPANSGTHDTFKELVLKGGNFGTTPNITTLQRDATTPLLQALGTDGIGYATYAQVARQQTVRVVAIDNVTPDSQAYPYKRTLYYVYKNPPTPAVQAFLGYTTSPGGQQAMLVAN